VETKVKRYKARRVVRCLPLGWSFCNNYDHAHNDIVWLCWNNAVWNCLLLDSSSQTMKVKQKNTGGLTSFLTVLYGSNLFNERAALWSNLPPHKAAVYFWCLGCGWEL